MPEETTTKHIDGIGPILIKKSKRARYIRIRVDPKNGVSVTKPLLVTDRALTRFVEEKKTWIQQALKRQQAVKNKITQFTETGTYTTRMHTLYLCKHAKKTIKSVVSNNRIVIWYPDIANVEDERVQQIIRRAILEAWRVEAKKVLPQRVDELARKHNLSYNKLTFKNAKTRWGSCSGKNNINLNLQLMRLPDPLIDYVILHELNHTVHKHHQKTFWLSLEQILPNARKLDKELNNYHLEYW